MPEILLQIPAELSSFKSMSHGSLRLQFDTQEDLTDEQKAKITSGHEKQGWLSFLIAERQIRLEEVKDLPEVEQEESYKTPSQRQRDILFRVWETKGKKGSFEEFYIVMMDKIASWLKEKYLN